MSFLKFATFRVTKNPFTVQLVIEKERGTQDEVKELMDGINSLFQCRSPFTLLIDARVMSSVDFSSAYDIAAFMKKNRENFKNFTLASAILIKSPLTRELIKTVFLIQPPASPNLVTTNEVEASKFLKRYL